MLFVYEYYFKLEAQEADEKPHTIFESLFGEEEDAVKDTSVSPCNIQTATQLLTNTMKPIGEGITKL